MPSSQRRPETLNSRPMGPESSEEMRQAILMSLDQLRSEAAGHSLVMKRLKEQYNILMEQIEREISASGVDPLRRLPPEISSRCLRTSLQERDYAQRLLELTTVSKRWQELIVSTPVLWMYIDVRGSQHDAMATLAIFLELSRATSIYLTIWNDPGEEWDEITLLLLPHQERICSIEMRQEKKQTPELQFSITSRIMRSLQRLPASSQVYFRDYPLELNPRQLEELGNYSNGCRLKNIDTRISSVPTKSNILALLGTLTTSDALGELGSKLVSMVNLTTVNFMPSQAMEESSPSSPFIDAPPRLTGLMYRQDFDNSLLLLIHSAFNTLQSLDVTIPSSKWRLLCNCLIDAVHLKELYIDLERSISRETTIIPFVPLAPIGALKSLYLGGNWWSGRTEARNPGEITFEDVFEACAILYPGIRSFTLDYLDFDSDYRALRMYLENLDSLEYLKIRGRTPNWEVDITPLLLQSLKRLDTQSTLLPYIEAPNLEWFTVPAGEELGTTRFGSILGAHIWFSAGDFHDLEPFLHGHNYPALSHITLELPSPGAAWRMPYLHSLRSVIIKTEDHLDQNATMFCLHVLYFPDGCPLLEEVELSGFVELDILILMLERRNFMIGGVRRISTLRIPLKPPFLESPLALLLSGKYSNRPSNKDLSTEGIRDALCSAEVYVTFLPLHLILNSLSPGCIYCVKNMIPGCKAEVTRSDGHFFRMDGFYTGYPKPPSGLPPDLLTWLLWHNDRIDTLKGQWIVFGREYHRQTACIRYLTDADWHEEGAFVDALTDSDPSSEHSF